MYKVHSTNSHWHKSDRFIFCLGNFQSGSLKVLYKQSPAPGQRRLGHNSLTVLSQTEHLKDLHFVQLCNAEQLLLAEEKVFHMHVLLTVHLECPHWHTDTWRRLFLPHIAGIPSRWSTQYSSLNFSLWSLFFFGVLRFQSHSVLFHMRPWDGAMCKPALTDSGNWEKGFFEDLGLVPLQDSLAPKRRWAVSNFAISDT